MRQEFEENGYYVLRGVLTDHEVDQLARPIREAFQQGDYDTLKAGPAYPAPGVHSMGPRVLAEQPQLADLSLAHPKIVAAIEELFGEEATLSQYWSIMRPPGAGIDDKPFVKGSGAHYDYKPWRCVGSYVKWMFAVIPFVDYTETAGPLAIAPGSHTKTTVLPSNGRVHQVDAAKVPAPSDIHLVDPSLKKGDVVLMHGFAWHEARPNYGNADRAGLYMKFYAKSSPPACGPTIYPSAVHEHLPDDLKHLIPHHRGDGKFAAVRDEPVGGVDEAQLLIEDSEERVLLLGDEYSLFRLPRVSASEDATARILDVCNVMGSVVAGIDEDTGLKLPWLSWLSDVTPDDMPDASAEWRCRVYAHQLKSAGPEIAGADGEVKPHCWVNASELAALVEGGSVEAGEQVLKWLHMWQHEVDENNLAVTRSYGIPTTDVQHYWFNTAGNAEGTYRIGEFDDNGRPTPSEPLST